MEFRAAELVGVVPCGSGLAGAGGYARMLARAAFFAPREVLVDSSGEVGKRAVAEERPGGVRNALDEVAIVGDDNEGAGPGVEDVL